MTTGQAERVTQNRAVALFVDELEYRYSLAIGRTRVSTAMLNYLTKAG